MVSTIRKTVSRMLLRASFTGSITSPCIRVRRGTKPLESPHSQIHQIVQDQPKRRTGAGNYQSPPELKSKDAGWYVHGNTQLTCSTRGTYSSQVELYILESEAENAPFLLERSSLSRRSRQSAIMKTRIEFSRFALISRQPFNVSEFSISIPE
ncbi:hypothetical protein DL93DRAFT_2079366 [Clavulina sp. PMI_390]|nr:hypothetical protein DL93DRAFT_2079366 [Clavulina sp. PMI_390]